MYYEERSKKNKLLAHLLEKSVISCSKENRPLFRGFIILNS
jgi:hypothetical protein